MLMKVRVSKYPLLNGFPIALFPSRKPDDPRGVPPNCGPSTRSALDVGCWGSVVCLSGKSRDLQDTHPP